MDQISNLCTHSNDDFESEIDKKYYRMEADISVSARHRRKGRLVALVVLFSLPLTDFNFLCTFIRHLFKILIIFSNSVEPAYFLSATHDF